MGELLAGFAGTGWGRGGRPCSTRSGGPTAARSRAASSAASATRSRRHVVTEFLYLALETDFRPQLRADQGVPARRAVPAGLVPRRDAGGRRRRRRWGCAATLVGATPGRARCSSSAAAPRATAYYVELCSPAPEFDRRYREARGRSRRAAAPCSPTTRCVRSRPGSLARAARGRGPRPGHSPRRVGACGTPSGRSRGRRGHRADPLRRARRPPAGRRSVLRGEDAARRRRGLRRAGWLGEAVR